MQVAILKLCGVLVICTHSLIAINGVHYIIRERGSVLYLGMAQEFWDFAKLPIA